MNAQLPFADRSAAARAATWVAALPMYDLPELEEANDQLWTAIGRRLRDDGVAGVPRRLTRGAPLTALWTDPHLLLAQACGYPLMTALAGRVRFVSTPRYGAPGCKGPFHRSAVVVRVMERADALAELAGARLALNDETSGTGMNLLRALIAPLAGGRPFFSEIAVTGSHLASAEAVAGGTAELAALDCVTWAHLRRLRPTLAAQLRVLAWSAESPGLPLITARQTDEATLAAIARALAEVSRDPRLAGARRELLLDGFIDLPEARYLSALHWKRFAADLGYPELR
jgi:ABC-type phosphate/phosphonate transport system substrate-binding protein